MKKLLALANHAHGLGCLEEVCFALKSLIICACRSLHFMFNGNNRILFHFASWEALDYEQGPGDDSWEITNDCNIQHTVISKDQFLEVVDLFHICLLKMLDSSLQSIFLKRNSCPSSTSAFDGWG